MKNSLFKLMTESFMGGVFGTSGQVPWEGPKTDSTQRGRFQIATDSVGEETYVIGGGVLSAVAPNAEAKAKEISQKILTYRNMQYYTEIDEAIEHIVNDIVSSESDQPVVEINLDKCKNLPEASKKKIREAFHRIQKLMDLNDNAYEVVRQFYIDGRRAYQIVMKEGGKGIDKLVVLDSASIRPAKLVEIEMKGNIEFIKSEKRTFLYNSIANAMAGVTSWTVNANQNRIIELDPESVSYSDSGMYSPDGRIAVGFLEPAVKPANNLRTVEDGTVIYAITRAIDKRAFYLDVDDLPKKSAEEYMNRQMERFKTKLNYNASSGEVDQNKVNISMVEDLWLPRRNGQNATEIQTLEAGKNVGEINHVQYFKEKLYASLKIPKSRLTEGSMVNIGGSDLAQTTREEWKFAKYTDRIGKRFSNLFKQPLKIELVTTGILDDSIWNSICEDISFEWTSDSYVQEQQENEILMGRLQIVAQAESYVGRLFSIQTIRKDFLRMSDEEIQEEDARIEQEKKDGLYEDYGESPLKIKSMDQPDTGGFGEFNDQTDVVDDQSKETEQESEET